MALATYLVNEAKKEYVYSLLNDMKEISEALKKLETERQWNLRTDLIFVWHTYKECLDQYSLVSV